MQRMSQLQMALLEIRAGLEKKLAKNQEVTIVPYYAGNKFYAVTYNVFKDVRMVFAPPSSVGKFGGDTDNWMWPRHTGDFSVFRVYANKDNAPANYSKDNVPYKPKYYATVSTEGYEKNDYAMTYRLPWLDLALHPFLRCREPHEGSERSSYRGPWHQARYLACSDEC